MKRNIGAWLVLPGLLTGCAQLVPETVLQTPTRSTWQQELAQMNVEPIQGQLTLDEAIARGLKYNLDRRAKQLEQDIASGQFDAAIHDLLPKARAQIDRSLRSEDRLTRNSNGTASNTTTDRNHSTHEIGMSWSLLEFGVGYYSAKQARERIYIANERRRKLTHTLIQDVRNAYWRAACAQVMRADLKNTIAKAEEALEDSRRIETERVRAPGESLAYQKQLLESLRTLEMIDQELAPAMVELATLINAPKGQNLNLKVQWPDLKGQFNASIEVLESLALERNADVREALHQSKIARDETRKVLARMFPNLSFNMAAKYDTDSYQVHKSWEEAGFQLSFNLMNLFTGPAQMRLAEAGVSLADQRRLVMQMATITQVHLGRLNWLSAQKQMQRAEQIWAVDERLAELANAREKALMRGSLETVTAQASALLSQFRRYQSVAQVQMAESRLQSVIGMEFEDAGLEQMSLKEVMEKIARAPSVWAIKDLKGDDAKR